jgi:ribose transport system substrate-binding protein
MEAAGTGGEGGIMKSRTKWLQCGVLVLALLLVVVLATACGGDGDTESSDTSAASSTTAATSPESSDTTAPSGTTTSAATPTTGGSTAAGDYDGIDKEFITELPEPTGPASEEFTVGFLLNNGAVGTLVAIQKAAQAQVEALGGKFIAYDAATDAQKQVSQMNQLISQKVNAILAYSITDATLTQGIKSAADAGIPVIQVEVPTNPETPLNPGAASLLTIAHDLGCWETMKFISEQTPGASVSFMNYGLPNEAIVHILDRGHYWAEQFGLTILPDEVSAINPSPAAASDAAQSILAKHPDVNYIVTFNDVSANATVNVLKAAGNDTIKVVTPNGGDAITAPLITDGSVAAVWAAPYEELGRQAAIAAYMAITNQGTIPERAMVAGQLATQDNVDSVTFVE